MSDKPKLVNPSLKSTLHEKPYETARLPVPPALTEPGKSNRRSMHLMLPIELHWRLSQHAMQLDVPRADVVMRALVAFLDGEGALSLAVGQLVFEIPMGRGVRCLRSRRASWGGYGVSR